MSVSNICRQCYGSGADHTLWADINDDDYNLYGTYGLTRDGAILDADGCPLTAGDNEEIYVRKILESIPDDEIEKKYVK